MRELDILPEEERREVLVHWNATERGYPREATLGSLFEDQVAREPRAEAVRSASETVSYGELNARANRLARALADRGVSDGAHVLVALERSPEILVAQLAVLKLGAAYVPLDAGQPASRQAFIASDCGASVVVTRRETRFSPELESQFELRRVDVDDARHDGYASENLGPRGSASSAAYVMYTSGTTGVPRG